jgi:DNA repair exonuclease SbcCD ATPase subunit
MTLQRKLPRPRRAAGAAALALAAGLLPPALTAGPVLLLALAPGGAQAQPTARDTDALRRLQRALQQAQQERDAARAELATLQRAQPAQARALQASQAKAARAQAEARQLRAALAQGQQVTGEQQQALALAAEQAAQAARAQEALQAQWQRERASLQRDLLGLRQTNEALVARLSASTTAQGELQRRNTALHALGLELLDLYRNADPAQAWGPGLVLGVAAVRREDRAELARQRLDALLSAPLPPAATAP